MLQSPTIQLRAVPDRAGKSAIARQSSVPNELLSYRAWLQAHIETLPAITRTASVRPDPVDRFPESQPPTEARGAAQAHCRGEFVHVVTHEAGLEAGK